MIFPLLAGFQSIFRAPVTWALFFLNLAVLIYTYVPAHKSQIVLENELRQSAYSQTQGLVFADYIKQNPTRYVASVVNLANRATEPGEVDGREILGGIAVRDNSFINHSGHLKDNIDDPIAFNWWKKKIAEFRRVRDADPSYQLGVTAAHNDLEHWITYQFVHSGVAHFSGNMLFFLIFGCSLEMIFGGLAVLVLYLLSGIAGAMMFMSVNHGSAIPLIGASAAISGIAAFFCIMLWTRPVRYIYFLFIPKRDYLGFAYLPAWITLALWMLSDIAGQWATPPGLGGIAYSAHVGGELCGVLAALILISLRKLRGQPVLPELDRFTGSPYFKPKLVSISEQIHAESYSQ